jgi:hypothetical protein
MKEKNEVKDVKERLEQLRMRPVRSARDAGLVEEAARLLGEIVETERRAARWVEDVLARSSASTAGDLSGLTLHEAARRVLEEAGTPLHARELGTRIKAGGWRHPRSANAGDEQIIFQLAARLPRYPHVFRRVAPNTFALAEWASRSKQRSPRVGLFRGPGRPIGRSIGDSEEPFGEGTPWRSS